MTGKKKITTMLELAVELDVSRQTLSRYFNDTGSVKDSTRLKIKNGLDKVDYVPNFFAMNMNRKRTRQIGVVIPDINDVVQSNFVKIIEERARVEDYIVIVQTSQNDRKREIGAIETLRSMNVDGIILSPLGNESDGIRILSISNDLPIVLIDSIIPGTEDRLDFVGTDNDFGMKIMVSYLVRSGKPPVFLPMPEVNQNASERLNAYNFYMNAAGLDPTIIEVDNHFNESWQFEEFGYNILKMALSNGKHTEDTILCANDRIAMGAVKAAQEFRLFEHNKDIATPFRIAGHDNDVLSRFIHPGLTTVSQDFDAIGRLAAETLISRLSQQANQVYSTPVATRIKPKLVVRDSA